MGRPILRRLAIVLLMALGVLLLWAVRARAEGPSGITVVSQPSFTAPGAVVSVELLITGTQKVDCVYAEYDLERLAVRGPGRYRSPQIAGDAGLNLLQWPAPAPRQATDGLWYRVVAEANGTKIVTPTQTLYYIPFGRWLNAGSARAFPNRDGASWEPDRPWFQGSYGYDGETRVISTTQLVRGAANYGEDDVYQHQRVSVNGRPFHYRFYYGPGIYQARLQIDLYFAELEKTGPGQRVFDVLVDGQPLAQGLDLYAVAGRFRAYNVSREVTVTYRLGGDQCLDIAFVPRVGEAAVGGVAVRSLSAIPQYTVSATVERWADDTYVVVPDNDRNREPWLRFGRYSDGFQCTAGLLFRRLAVPRQAFISSAALELWSHPAAGWQYGQANVTVYAQAADTASDFSRHQPKVTVRPLTSAGAPWTIDRSWPPNQAIQSADLSAPLQEVIDRPGWKPGHNLALLIRPDDGPVGWRDVVAYDWPGTSEAPAHSLAPRLVITYVPPDRRPAP